MSTIAKFLILMSMSFSVFSNDTVSFNIPTKYIKNCDVLAKRIDWNNSYLDLGVEVNECFIEKDQLKFVISGVCESKYYKIYDLEGKAPDIWFQSDVRVSDLIWSKIGVRFISISGDSRVQELNGGRYTLKLGVSSCYDE